MRNFFSRFFWPTIALAAVAVHAVTMYACTQVDENLGLEYVPDNQKMKIAIDTVTGITTFVTYSDTSLVSPYRGQMFLGSMVDPVFGKTKAGTVVQLYPYEDDFNDGKLFGYMPVADSLRLTMHIDKVYGRDEVEQTFYVYAITDSLPTDTAYYHSFPVDKYVDFDQPLFSFTMKDETMQSVKLMKVLGEAGQKYMQSMVDVDPKILKDPFEKYRSLFHGLYIAPAPTSPEDAAVYKVDLETSDRSNYSMFTIFAHNYVEGASVPTVDTTVYTQYIMSDKPYNNVLLWPNIAITVVDHEFSPEILSVLNDTLPTSSSKGTIYVQGLFGVASILRFPEDLATRIDNLRFRDGIEYSAITVNKAMLYIPLAENSVEALDNAPNRLGTYTNYTGLQPSGSADYNYTAEENNYTLSYGGYLNRSNNYYSMDLTTHISYLLHEPEMVPEDLWLGPEVYTIAEYYSQVVLKGTGGGEALKLALTYTLVK